MASNNNKTTGGAAVLTDYVARPADLQGTVHGKHTKTGHTKFGDMATAVYSKECGGVNSGRVKLPEGLALADMPFSFTGSGGLRSADRRAVPLNDWRYTPAAWSYWRAACRLSLGYADGAAVAYYRHQVLLDRYHDHKQVSKRAAGADAWALVDPAAVRAWLALIEDVGVDGMERGAAVAPPYAVGGECFARMTDDERQKLADGRRRSKAAAAERLAEQEKIAGVSYFRKIWHYINCGAPAAPEGRWLRGDDNRLTGAFTDTAGAVIAQACRRWGAQALARPIRETGSAWLLALRDQQYEIDARQAAIEYATGALMGGPVVSAAPGLAAGGRRYKISGKRSAVGSIRYKERRRRSSTGALESAGVYAVDDTAAAEIKAAQDRAAVGVRATELDAIINSCACPDTDDFQQSLLFWLARDCGALDDVTLPFFRKRAFWGACQEINAERSDYNRSSRGGFAVVSLETEEENGGGPTVDFDDSGLLLADVVKAARVAAPEGREDDFEKFLRLRLSGYTKRAAAELLNIAERTAGKWEVKITHQAAADGLAEGL